MIFRFVNFATAQAMQLNVTYIVISITTPNSSQAVFIDDPNRKDILRLQFHDLDKRPPGMQWGDGEIEFDIVLFTDEMAKEIVEFVRKYENEVQCIICHCEAGISRSPAVIAALVKVYHGDDAWVFKSAMPNRLVYQKMLKRFT